MRLLVGLTTLIGSIERYAERFDLLELRADPERLPAPKVLRRMRTAAPKLGMSLLLPPRMTSALLDAKELPAPLVTAADLLVANWFVVQTGPELGPSRHTRTRLEALVQRLRTPSRRVAWEPRGPWEEDAARVEAETLGVTLIQDLSVAVGYTDSVVYTRLRALGPGAQLRPSALEQLAEELAEADEATVVIEGHPNQRARARIAAAIAGSRDALDDGEDDDGEEKDDDTEDDDTESGAASDDDDDTEDDEDEDDTEDDEDDEDDAEKA